MGFKKTKTEQKQTFILWIACWFHCRANLTWLRRNSGIDQTWHEMKYTDAPKLQVSWKLPLNNAIYHIVSNVLFSWHSLDKSSPHNGNSKVLVRTSGWKKKKKRKKSWNGLTLYCTWKSSLALCSAGRKRICLYPFQSLEKFIYLLPYAPEYTNLSEIYQWHQRLGTSDTIQKSDM